MNEVQTMPNTESDKEVLRDILSGREYMSYHSADGSGRSWLRRVWDYLVEKLSDLMPDTALPRSAADLASYMVILAGVLLLVFLLVWIGRRIAFDRRLPRRIGLSEKELASTYADYLRLAGEAASGGGAGLQEGIRAVFLAFLLYADDRSWLKAELWKANGEYSMELAVQKPDVQPLFTEASRLFEEVWYGKRGARPEELQGLLQRVSQMIDREEGRYAY